MSEKNLILKKELPSVTSPDGILHVPSSSWVEGTKLVSDEIATTGWVEKYTQNSTVSYKSIFTNLCKDFPDKEDEYKTLLKLYNNNYRTVVILIEYENLKTENKLLNGVFNDEQ